MATCKGWTKKANSKNFGMVPIRRRKKGKTSKFADAGGYNRNERKSDIDGGREGERSWQLGVGQQEGAEKENKTVTLETERCQNIKNLHIQYIHKHLS